MRYFDIEYVREHLEELVEEAAVGSSFVITVNGWPKAIVEPIDHDRGDQPRSKWTALSHGRVRQSKN